jgi:hypothetical protein
LIIGGFIDEGKSVYRYKLSTGSLEKVQPMNHARIYPAMELVEDKLFVFGGAAMHESNFVP